jgi:diguanylate cyclase (GGDEF)-like protein
MSSDKLRILLIEDDTGDAVLLRRTLEPCADRIELHHVLKLNDGIAAWHQHAFDVFLLDLSLPDSSGLDGVTILRREIPEAPIVVLTGNSDNQLALEALDHGAQEYLVKGQTSGAVLERTIRHAIHRHHKQLQRENQVTELKELARIDPLTSLLNRQALDEVIAKEWSRADRNDTPLSCVLIDLDHFKRINDTYGHLIGDEVLKVAADLLLGNSRDNDHIARYGGEEFCAILPDTDGTGAWTWADRVRQSLSDREFHTSADTISITASFGVASKSPRTPTPDDLIHAADQALYAAKQQGRNRTVAADISPALQHTVALPSNDTSPVL